MALTEQRCTVVLVEDAESGPFKALVPINRDIRIEMVLWWLIIRVENMLSMLSCCPKALNRAFYQLVFWTAWTAWLAFAVPFLPLSHTPH